MRKAFCNFFRFILEVVGKDIEHLPSYEIKNPYENVEEAKAGVIQRPAKLNEVSAPQLRSQQGVKRSCGHAQENVRKNKKN